MKIEEKIKNLAREYSDNLKIKIDNRMEEMKEDDKSHYLIYQVLGITNNEGDLIDLYQNKGRFLYKYAGSFLEAATKWLTNHSSGRLTLPLNLSVRVVGSSGKQCGK